jgi:hypothetical protein
MLDSDPHGDIIHANPGISVTNTVPPAVRVLSPARAPRGLHRALFMNSVSHGKIWTENAASL